DDADAPGLVDVAGHDADLALGPRGDDPGAVRPDEPDRASLQRALHLHHVQHRDALGDDDDQRHARVRGLEDGVPGERRRHEDHADVGTGLLHRVGHGVEDRHAVLDLGPALPRRHTGDELRPVVQHLPGVERACRAGDALHQHPGVLIDEDAHDTFSPRAAATAFSAACRRLSAGMMGSPDLRRISLPRSTLVPSSRTTSGTLSCTSRAAATTPSAMTSPFMIPPKMLISTAFTAGELRMRLKASGPFSLLAPPPTSRKFAGCPPTSLMVSIVAIARPAPFTMQPMLPS